MIKGMFDVLIIEDEVSATKSLLAALQRIWAEREYSVVGTLESIRETVDFLQTQQEPDLIFMDIQLSDGLSFEIFKQHQPKCPIVFITAYDDYAIKAFEVNGLHYLLKPVSDEDLAVALDRFQGLNGEVEPSMFALKNLLNQMSARSYKERFLVHSKGSMITVKATEIQVVSLDEGSVWLHTLKGEKFKMTSTMDKMEVQLNPNLFYRASRQAIIAKEGIQKVDPYFNQRLSVTMKSFNQGRILISKSKSSEFKRWLEE